MYEELVKSLQSCPDAEYGCSGCKYKKSLGCREKLMAEAADAIEELSGLLNRYGGETGIKNLQEYASKYLDTVKNAPHWIPVTDDSPKEGFPVLGAFKFQGGNGCIVTERITINGEEIWSAAMGMKPFAWMPCQEPPGEE